MCVSTGQCVNTTSGCSAARSRRIASTCARVTSVAPSIWPKKTGFAPMILQAVAHSAERIRAASSNDLRSEERRVGKEWRWWWVEEDLHAKEEGSECVSELER